MPRGDGTGPWGTGPFMGRRTGYCGGPRPLGTGPSVFSPYRGFRRFQDSGAPSYGTPSPDADSTLPAREEIALLRSEAQRLRSVLEGIENRLQQLEMT